MTPKFFQPNTISPIWSHSASAPMAHKKQHGGSLEASRVVGVMFGLLPTSSFSPAFIRQNSRNHELNLPYEQESGQLGRVGRLGESAEIIVHFMQDGQRQQPAA